jgi:diguanylate cyclase (GGDEF)-like protein
MRIGIRVRLLGAFAGLAAITLGLGLWSFGEVSALARMETVTYDRPLMATAYINLAATSFEQLANPALAQALAARAQAGDDPVGDLFGEIGVARARASSAAAAAAIDHAATLAHAYLNRPDPAAAAAARLAFEMAGEQVLDDGFLSRAAAAAAEAKAKRYGLIAAIVATSLSMALALAFAGRFVGPIRAATAIADRIAAGNLTEAVRPGRNDEIGTLLAALGIMQARIRSMIEAEQMRVAVVERRLDGLLSGAREATVLLDADDRFVATNAPGRLILEGLGAKLAPGAKFAELLDDRHRALLLGGEPEFMLADGTWLAPSRHGLATGGWFLVLTDITLRKDYEARLEFAAFRDPLTGLRNRGFFTAALDRDGAIQPGDTLMLANLDRFRQINTIFGTAAGDAVIVEAGRRLAARLAPEDLCARINGDELAIFMPQASAERLAALTAALAEDFAVPVMAGPASIPATLRIGLTRAASLPKAQTLLSEARAALDHARHKGPGQVVMYDDALRAAARKRNIIARDLPEAIATRAIQLEYQPLISLASGGVVGVEALARWHHPELGKIPPPEFIGPAEESGAIIALGHLLITKAAAFAGPWSALQQSEFTIAINLSPRQLADPQSVAGIFAFLDEHRALTRLLKFEVTESLLIDDPEAMLPILCDLKARGVQLSLDDFGTGFSSLSYLHKFPFDVLKIDQCFVRDIDRNTDARRLVQTIVELGRDLGMILVAEGVETPGQAALLRELGAHIGQGYLFSRPLPPERIPEFIAARKPAENMATLLSL